MKVGHQTNFCELSSFQKGKAEAQRDVCSELGWEWELLFGSICHFPTHFPAAQVTPNPAVWLFKLKACQYSIQVLPWPAHGGEKKVIKTWEIHPVPFSFSKQMLLQFLLAFGCSPLYLSSWTYIFLTDYNCYCRRVVQKGGTPSLPEAMII